MSIYVEVTASWLNSGLGFEALLQHLLMGCARCVSSNWASTARAGRPRVSCFEVGSPWELISVTSGLRWAENSDSAGYGGFGKERHQGPVGVLAGAAGSLTASDFLFTF